MSGTRCIFFCTCMHNIFSCVYALNKVDNSWCLGPAQPWMVTGLQLPRRPSCSRRKLRPWIFPAKSWWVHKYGKNIFDYFHFIVCHAPCVVRRPQSGLLSLYIWRQRDAITPRRISQLHEVEKSARATRTHGGLSTHSVYTSYAATMGVICNVWFLCSRLGLLPCLFYWQSRRM